MRAEQVTAQRTRKVDVTTVFDRNYRASKPVVVNIGGADSSKSYSIAQLLIQKYRNESNKNFLITRKTLPSLRITAYRLVIDLLKDYGYYPYLKHNKSERTLYNRANNNFMLFTSLDDPEKIKSAEFNYEWLEETNEFSWEDFIILKLRLRHKTTDGNPNRMYLSFNPADEQGWINQRLMEEPDVEIVHSTYEDNPFAAEVDIGVLEGLKDQDESYWRIYAKGEFARIKGLIHTLHILTTLPEECPETIYGLDFGFINPNALLQVDIDMEHMALYLSELLYETGMTNAQLKQRLKVLIPPEHRSREIYADSAEPARIEEIGQEGFNIHSSDKSVIDGIDCVNRFKLYATEESVSLKREIGGYKRKVNRNGAVLEEPVKYNDHCPNALRYAVYTHLRERLIGYDPAWTYHIGMKEKEAEKEKTAVPREEKAPESPVTDERKATKGKAKGDSQGEEKKKEPRDDESWVV